MNVGDGEMHPFLEGKSVASLSSILEPEGEGTATNGSDNLYLATVNGAKERHVPIGLRNYYRMMPRLRAADFDYIIFDMPALGTTSPTLGMLGFMDKVLLVLEADRSDKAMIKRSYAELIDSRANISCVFNKTRAYGPKWLQNATS
jgi:hypothetical protein